MSEQPNEPFKPSEQPQNPLSDNSQTSAEAMAQLKSAQTLITIATIGGPVSLIIGGMLLSGISAICGLIAYFKVKKICEGAAQKHDLVSKVKRSAIIAIVISICAFAVNAVYVAMVMPAMLEVLESGDVTSLQELMGNTSSSNGTSSSGSTSVWG